MVDSTKFWLVCPRCGREFEPGPRWHGCETCLDAAGYPHWLEVRYDLKKVDSTFLRQEGRVWDYAPLLPVHDPARVLTLGEGRTPLVQIEALNRELGLPNLFLKLESVNPTASFKDRLHTVSMAVAREMDRHAPFSRRQATPGLPAPPMRLGMASPCLSSPIREPPRNNCA